MSSPLSPAVPDTSWSLLRSVQDGSPEGWSRLVFLYAPVLARWCRRAGLQDADADNVVQEVFVTLARHIISFRSDRGSGRFRAFLATVARTRIADHHRREGRRPVQLDAAACQFLKDPAPDGTQVDAVFRDLELRRALDVVRSEVAASTWEAFQRTVLEEQAAAEVATVLGLTVGAVRLARFRVLRKLRGLLE
jgi:RNA polymerase sigma-70 factor, ECF subfamily